MTIMQSIKSGTKKILIYGAAIYAVGVGVDYHLKNDSINQELLAIKDNQVKSLLDKDTEKYSTLEKQVSKLERDQDKIFFSHSVEWPYTAGKDAVNLVKKIF